MERWGICEDCGQEMAPGVGCTTGTVLIEGRPYGRIPYGGAGDQMTEGVPDEVRAEALARQCHDCNVVQGQVHHSDCDMETCPKCGDQFIGCDCD